MNNVEKMKQALRKAADDVGYKIVHVWSIDLQDGSHNVHAIIETPDGISFSDGRRVYDRNDTVTP